MSLHTTARGAQPPQRLGGAPEAAPRVTTATAPAVALATAALRAPYRGFAAAAPAEARGARQSGTDAARAMNSLAAADVAEPRAALPDLAAVSDDASRALSDALRKAAHKAVDGGLAGAAAQCFNVGALIWMRTTVNFQYRHGMTTTQAFRHLYNDGGRGLGGVLRFYRGIGPALLQAPLARFGDTAANAGTLALLESLDATRDAPVWAKTGAASVAAGGFRILLMPIDAMKTVMQVEGAAGMALLRAKIAASGPRVLWAGALGSAGATLVGHYPWFLVYNELNAALPQYDRKTELAAYLGRNAAIGFAASAVSDTLSNSIRVLKTTKQASAVAISYGAAARMVIAADGVQGLFFRGLKTKIAANGAQGMLFSVLWRLGQDALDARAKAA